MKIETCMAELKDEKTGYRLQNESCLPFKILLVLFSSFLYLSNI